MEVVLLGIDRFISAHALSLHREYLEALRAKKCMGLDAKEGLELKIRSHELYFSSFRTGFARCERAARGYGSENAFIFALREFAEAKENCFLYVFPRNRYPYVGFSADPRDAFRSVLCVDLFEHAYFLDYGFDKNAYLHAALSHLDLSLLDRDFQRNGKIVGE